MRPVHLSVAGLHSFREKQEIDFQTLCDGGVFGIFGPTGSGKSSLLDAMTLALYGKVERASNNTQGIMNHAEDEISVSFTFELGQAQGTERYKIERSYKRVGDVSIRTVACRLVQLFPEAKETVVLADKANEVQDKLYELIGLTIDDFTRAVVLPQGKFAEFLSLKGVERRQMLQRLFHLEQYGDQLNERIKSRMGRLKNRLNEIVAEQQGLGEASREALQAIEQKVREIAVQAEQLLKDRQDLERQFEQVKQWREWQGQLEQVESMLEQVLMQQEGIDTLQERIALAEEAQQLKPYVEEVVQAEQEKQAWSQKALEQRAKREEATRIESEKEKVYTLKKEEKENRHPGLIERVHVLKQMKQLQIEVHARVAEKKKLEETLHIEKEQWQYIVAEQKKQTDVWHRAKDKQKELKARLAGISISFEQKQKLQKAYQSYVLIEQQQRQVQQIVTEVSQAQVELHKVQKSKAAAENERQQTFSQGKELLQQIRFNIQRSEKFSKALEQVLAETQQQIVDKQKLVEQALEAEWVNRLVQGLHEGEPCPVCGALEHPQPGAIEQINISSYREEIDHLERWIYEANRVEAEHRFLVHQLQESQNQLVEWLQSELDQGDVTNPELSTAGMLTIEQLAAAAGHTDINERTAWLEWYQQHAVDTQRSLEAHKAFMLKSKTSSQYWRELNFKLEAAEQHRTPLAKKGEEAQQKLEQLKADFSEQFSEWPLEQLAETYTQLQQQEQQAADLQERIEKSIFFIEEKEAELKQLDTQAVQRQMKVTELTSMVNQLHTQIIQDQQKITEQIREKSVTELLHRAENDLEQITKDEKLAYEAWQSSREALTPIAQAFAIAEESLRQAEARGVKAEQQILQQLQETRFTTWQQVQEAYVSKEKLSSWKETLATFKEKKQSLLRDQDVLQTKLGEHRVTADEWDTWIQSKQELEQSYQQIIEARGAAQKELATMQEKHARYMALEQEKLRVDKEYERFGQLQTVFRGNSFVEYIAEEQLVQVCRTASSHLGQLTRQRYALEVDSQGGFVIRDDANGGVRRPVSTLSGGETFLTSLSLALALSAQIQLRGQYPLEFFFLDEGFGTLDPELLDAVVSALENLHLQQLAVGVISHVAELRERLPKKLIITPAEPSGRGSRVHLETL